MVDSEESPKRKRRTREHVIADLSTNYLERLVLQKGHVLRRPEHDYGVDAIMFHFDEQGQIENGEIRFQLKASDALKVIRKGSVISFPIKTGDLDHWSMEIHPFILVVFDAQKENAYWLHIQEYVVRHRDALDGARDSINVHIPVASELTASSVDFFRALSLKVIQHLRSQGGFPDVSRKPK